MSKDKLESLDKAQQELNRVLELLGRLFVAAKSSNRATALATATRLKQTLPATTKSYHEALDELDQQLQHAKLVMRRDLAVAIARTNVPDEVQPIVEDDVAKDEPSIQTDATKAEPTSPDGGLQLLKAEGETDNTSIEKLDSKQDLKLDTAQPPQPDTKDVDDTGKGSASAVSNNADMDSLFNDPVSAGGQPGDESAANASFEFGNDTSAPSDFDFGEFSAGLDTGEDEITAIPGLHDFTGTDDTTAVPDFSALFSNASASQNVPNESQAADEFNFDDMMDFSDGTNNNTIHQDTSNEFDLDFS